MSVLVEAISVIIRRSTLEQKYPGGIEAYARDCPNRTYCADDNLSRVGFMSSDEVRQFVTRLERFGIEHLRDGGAVDVVVVDQFRGPTSPCTWLEAGRHPDGYSAAWLAGTIPGWFRSPQGWTIKQSADLKFVSEEERHTRLLGLAHEGGLDVVLDLNTGREAYVQRPGVLFPEDDENERDRILAGGSEPVQPRSSGHDESRVGSRELDLSEATGAAAEANIVLFTVRDEYIRLHRTVFPGGFRRLINRLIRSQRPDYRTLADRCGELLTTLAPALAAYASLAAISDEHLARHSKRYSSALEGVLIVLCSLLLQASIHDGLERVPRETAFLYRIALEELEDAARLPGQ